MLWVIDGQFQKPSRETMFLQYSTHAKRSRCQIAEQKGGYSDSKQGIDGQKQAQQAGPLGRLLWQRNKHGAPQEACKGFQSFYLEISKIVRIPNLRLITWDSKREDENQDNHERRYKKDVLG